MASLSVPALKYVLSASSLVVAAAGLASAEWFDIVQSKSATLLNCFTGGVIIATALAHLLADAVEEDDSVFPWCETLTGVGYGVLLSVELFAMNATTSSKDNDSDNDRSVSLINNEAREIKFIDAPSTLNHSASATLALVVHSIGDGAAIALENSKNRLVAISGAILVHKFFAACALGTVLAKAKGGERKEGDTKQNVAYGLAFAFTTPVSIVAIVASGQTFPSGSAVAARVSSACSGTLLYVGIHEILPLGLEAPNVSLGAKLASFWIGYGAMSLLAIWA